MFKPARHIGIDLGVTGPKIALLERKGKEFAPPQLVCMDAEAEGMLTEKEQLAGIREWLVSHKWTNADIAACLPQFMATTLVRDFPVAKPRQLAEMVRLETAQVAGLSDEAMVQSFCRLPAGLGRGNPVLIGVTREQAAQERLDSLTIAGLQPTTLGLGGLAIVNAFLHLHPEKATKPEPVMLVDLGRENATAVILAAGQPLYLASLMFSGEKLEQALRQGAGEGVIQLRRKSSVKDIVMTEEAPGSPVVAAVRFLENEIRACMEQWRNSESEEFADAKLAEVYLCGGVARLRGLADWLSGRLDIPVEVFGPKEGEECRPECALALGLALQSAGLAAVPLDMMPPQLQEKQLREKSWPWLAGALAWVACTIFVLQAIWLHNMAKQILELEELQQKLHICTEIVPQIETVRNDILRKESRLIPLVDGGAQSVRIRQAIHAMGEACAEGDWFIYFADEESYQSPVRQQKEAREKNNRPPQNSFFDAPAAEPEENGEFPVKRTPAQAETTQNYIAAGFTPQLANEPFGPIKALIGNLEQHGHFKNIDLLPEAERTGRPDVFIPWVRFLNGLKKPHKAWSIRIPIPPQVDKSRIPPEPKLKRGRKK
ncbi:MAG: pilus assembly protein PilM [Victivallales bacterium]|nr:pilus assembly protein PilM [Victivallales bacterium]